MRQGTLRWRHIILTTHSTWLHGSQRGFRSRHHRIHSSGDYKNPPPSGEHAGLHRYQLAHSAPPTVLAAEAFKACGSAIVANAQRRKHDLRAISVNPTHVHFIILLPDDIGVIQEIVGWMKWFATRAIREWTDEFDDVEIWAQGEGKEPIDNDGHLRAAINYVLNKQGNDAWTWCPERGGKW